MPAPDYMNGLRKSSQFWRL